MAKGLGHDTDSSAKRAGFRKLMRFAKIEHSVFSLPLLLAGAKLGAVEFGQAQPALIALAKGWAIAMPALLRLARQFDGIRAPGLMAPMITGWRTPVNSGAVPGRPWNVS